MAAMIIPVTFTFYNNEIRIRRNIALSFNKDIEKLTADVLQKMPDAILIADSKGLKYINEEAWKLFNCFTEAAEIPVSSFGI
jgi:hypothetical protein